MLRLTLKEARFAVLAVLCTCAPLAAQIRPGIERGDYWGDVRARYRSEVLADVGVVMDAWQEAWNNDDEEALFGTYAEDAVFVLGREAIRGEDRLRTVLSETLRAAGAIQTGLQDFDVSGDMAFATTTYQYVVDPGPPQRTTVSGLLVWVLVKHTGSWKIRSQIFRPAVP